MEQKKDPKLTLSVTEAAKALSLSATKVYELTRAKGFPSFTVGNRILISAKLLEAWVAAQATSRAEI